MYQWVEATKALAHKKPLPILSFPGMQLMEGATVRELVANPALQAECMALVAENTPSAAAVSFMDLSLEAEAFGSEILFFDEDVPAVQGAIVSSEEEALALAVPPVGAGRTGMCVDAIRMAKERITDRPVFAGVIGPFSLTGRLVDVSEAMIYCFTEPDMLHILLEKCVEFSIEYIKAFKQAGADGVVLAEPLAGVISPAQEEEFSAPYIKKIVDAVQDENFLVIYHNCGNYAYKMTDSFKENGCRVFHFGNSVDMAHMLREMGEEYLVMGNIAPAEEFRNGTEQTMTAAVKDLMERCGSYPNFVPSSGCDVPPMASWDNIRTFFRCVEEYYTAK